MELYFHNISKLVIVIIELNVKLFLISRFWFLLLDDLDISEKAIKLMKEVRMSRQVLELNDIRLLASIHKTRLKDVLSRVNKIGED